MTLKKCQLLVKSNPAYFINHLKSFTDGNWTDWSEWSPCSETCGSGNQTQTRTCDNPRPDFGGNNCSDTNTDSTTIPCQLIECPIRK